MWLFVLFLAVPLIEIALFIQVGGVIGLWPTLAIVIFTAALGTMMIRAQGVLAMNEVRSSFSNLRDPTEPLAHGAMILFSGALLLTPGFFTDFVGFALLIPAVRKVLFSYLRSKVKVQSFSTHTQTQASAYPSDSVIEGDFEEIDNSAKGKSGQSGWTKH